MKNKKAIIILSVLILLFLISGVSANDINTTEVSTSDIDDVTSANDVDLNDENYVVELKDEPKDLDDSKILSASSDGELTAQNNLNDSEILIKSDVNYTNDVGNDLKENAIDNSNNGFNKEISSSSNSEILGTSTEDILSGGSFTSVSFSSNSVTVSFSVVGDAFEGTSVTVFADVNSNYYTTKQVTLDSNFKWSGSITINSGTYTPGTSYRIAAGIQGQSTMAGSFLYSKETPTVTVSSKSVNYNTGTYSVSGTCSVNGLTITLKTGSTTLGSTTSSGGSWTVSGISSTLFSPSSYTLTATSTATTSYNSASGTNTLTVLKSTPTIVITSKSINYNSGTYSVSGSVKVNSNNVGTGTITLKQGSTTLGTASVSGGSWTVSNIDSTLFTPSSSAYTITASYASNTYYNAASGTGSLAVSKSTPTIVVTTSPNIIYGNGIYSVSGTAKVGSNNVGTGTVTLKQGDIILGTASVSGGSWTVSNIDSTLFAPSSSAYTIAASYASNTYYNAASSTGSLIVNKFTPDIIIDSSSIFYNQSDKGVISGRVYKYDGNFYEGNIDLYIDGELIDSNIEISSNGYWTYTLSSTTNLQPKSTAYAVRIDWGGNTYTETKSTTENKYTVSKGPTFPNIQITGNIDYGRVEYVYVYVSNVMGDGYLSGIDVTLTGTGISGTLTNATDSSGMATFSISNLERGRYNDWKVSVISNDYYLGRDNVAVSTFYVQSPLNVLITGISPNNSTFPEEIIITGFTDADQIPQGNVSLTIGGKSYTGFFDSNSNFTASLIGVKPGTYNNITAKYNPTVDEFYYRGVESTVSIQETRNIKC